MSLLEFIVRISVGMLLSLIVLMVLIGFYEEARPEQPNWRYAWRFILIGSVLGGVLLAVAHVVE